MFSYRQLKRSFYIWFIQQVGLAEAALVDPGFWESLWADWSPGYDAGDDIAELRRHVTADNIASVICSLPCVVQPAVRRSGRARPKQQPTMQPPPVPTLYLHGADDGAIGADLLGDLGPHLPAAGSVARDRRRRRSLPASREARPHRGQDRRLARLARQAGIITRPDLISHAISLANPMSWLVAAAGVAAVTRPIAALAAEPGRVAQFGEELIWIIPADHVVTDRDPNDCCRRDIGCSRRG